MGAEPQGVADERGPGVITLRRDWSEFEGHWIFPIDPYDQPQARLAGFLFDVGPRSEHLAEAVRSIRRGPAAGYGEGSWLVAGPHYVLEGGGGYCLVIDGYSPCELVLTMDVTLQVLEAAIAMIESPDFRRPGASLPDLSVEYVAFGKQAWRRYLELGGLLTEENWSSDDRMTHGVAREIDGEWYMVDDTTGLVEGPLGAPGGASAPGRCC